MFSSPLAWLHGLLSAFITGGASAAAAMVIKPDAFNFGAGLNDLGKMFVVSGIIGALAYLKASPLPAIKQKIEDAKAGLGIVLLVCGLALSTGCASTGGRVGGTTVQDFTPAIKTAAFGGAWYALKEHPEWRIGFETAVADLKILETADKIDFATLMAIAMRLPVDELKSEEAQLAITGATILLSGYGGKLVELDKLENVRPVATALREGIELALK
jgi:hypothetical protein